MKIIPHLSLDLTECEFDVFSRDGAITIENTKIIMLKLVWVMELSVTLGI